MGTAVAIVATVAHDRFLGTGIGSGFGTDDSAKGWILGKLETDDYHSIGT